MRVFRWILLTLALVIVVRLSVYTIDASEYGYVTVLGRHVSTLDGGGDDAGLYVGLPWPFQSVRRIDRRLQIFDLKQLELLTPDPDGKSVDKNLIVDACVFWKVAGHDKVDQFMRRLGSPEQAKAILGERVTSQLGAAISRLQLNQLISTARAKDDPDALVVEASVEALRRSLVGELKESFLSEYGIELVDIRIRRYNYPKETRESTFDTIRSGRRRKREEYQADGKRKFDEKAAETERDVRTMLAEARREEQRIKSEADAEALLIRNRAHALDPDFYAFLKKMEQYQSLLGEGRTTLLLSTHRPMFDLLFGPPARPGKGTPEEKKGSAAPGDMK